MPGRLSLSKAKALAKEDRNTCSGRSKLCPDQGVIGQSTLLKGMSKASCPGGQLFIPREAPGCGSTQGGTLDAVFLYLLPQQWIQLNATINCSSAELFWSKELCFCGQNITGTVLVKPVGP